MVRQRQRSGFLGHNHADAPIEAFRDSEGRKVPCAIAAVALAREREDHTCSNDAVAFDDHGPVMERGVGGKEIEDQLTAELGINGDP